MRSSLRWVFFLVGLSLACADDHVAEDASTIMRKESRAKEDKLKIMEREAAAVKTMQKDTETHDTKPVSHHSSSKTTMDSSGVKTTPNMKDEELSLILELEDDEDDETDAMLEEL